MRKEYFFISLAMALLVLGLAGGMANTLQHTAPPRSAAIASFVVSRPVVRPGERTKIAVNIHSSAGETVYTWRADAGILSTADSDHVEWTAPPSEGVYFISVAISDPAGTAWHGSTRIVVTRHPADPLVMSVDPAGLRQNIGTLALESSSSATRTKQINP